MRKLYFIFSLALFLSCSAPHRKLDDGKGNSVPKEGYVWANQSKFKASIYKEIDTDYFYELVDEYWRDNQFNKVRSIPYETLWKKKLQFYPNGKVRRFASKLANPNPEVTGNRGLIYKEGNTIKIDFFESVSGSSVGINTYTVKLEGDTIYMFENTLQNEKQCAVFKKSDAVDIEYKKYPANW